jgi:hypothetical protein
MKLESRKLENPKKTRKFDGNHRSLKCVQRIGTAPAPFLLTDERRTEGRAFVPASGVKGEHMKKIALLSVVCLASLNAVSAQNQKTSHPSMIHNGTILPIQLSSTISLAKAAPGQTISARIAQDVPLENGVLRRGTRISGHIVAVTLGNPSRIGFTFDKIEYSKSDSVSVETNLRVLASNLEIDSASAPTTGSDRGTPEVWWNTVQVGGEALYGSGPLMRGDQILGRWVPGAGAVGKVEANGKCRGEVAGNTHEQALWRFSSDACGVYGYSALLIEQAGRSTPAGQITLRSTDPNLKIRRGSGMLLRVDRS